MCTVALWDEVLILSAAIPVGLLKGHKSHSSGLSLSLVYTGAGFRASQGWLKIVKLAVYGNNQVFQIWKNNTAYYALHTINYTKHTEILTLHTANFTLKIKPCTLDTKNLTLHTSHKKMYTAYLNLNNTQCALHTAH